MNKTKKLYRVLINITSYYKYDKFVVCSYDTKEIPKLINDDTVGNKEYTDEDLTYIEIGVANNDIEIGIVF